MMKKKITPFHAVLGCGGPWFSSTSRDWVYDAGLGDLLWTIGR